ncbi:hypothetical protein M2189_000243 [Bradyrhizobium japonicum]|uniref:hypothetical protein n=1 Tax=Bradyrhizobium japonicum TaxID=375 RepID=UPI0021695246|nr:hypothetical protein [Bradyrhizobium japonicum]MCS3500805.1 hypothetical protein [Bradyrhizobium japonicum]MCS3957040.1 hypothetical protein [Bradyrhizobium japonicum]MCS3998788.1 hypothetical protein [Bradyrhizobium japonicum]
MPLKLRFVVTSSVDDERCSIPAFRFIEAQVRLLESGKVLCCDEYEKSEQDHRRDVGTHAGAVLDSGAMVFELREVEHAQNVAGPCITNRISAASRSRSKRYDISPVVRLISLHLAPRSHQAALAGFQ